jgi:uncharacterized protein YcbX
MITITEMYIAPVKALSLQRTQTAFLDKPGIAGDRAFFIVDERGQLITQRDFGALVQVAAEYDVSSERLALAFPSGETVAGAVELGSPVTTGFWEGRPVSGREVAGSWNSALSEFAGRPLRLVKAERPGQSFDAYPISLCSMASLQALASAAEVDLVDGRRFRQNIYVEGCSAHEEDTWIDGEIRVGAALLRVKMADPRCAVTTLSPDTGAWDMNTLKLIASYRTDQPKDVNFGVYCTVVEPGTAAVGDTCTVAVTQGAR